MHEMFQSPYPHENLDKLKFYILIITLYVHHFFFLVKIESPQTHLLNVSFKYATTCPLRLRFKFMLKK